MDAPDGSAAREHDRIETEIGRTGRSSDPFASAVRATRMPMLITDPNQPDNPIIFSNDAFAKLTGYTREEILGRNCRFLQGPETDRADVDKIRRAIELRVPIEIELLNHKKDGEVFWNRLLISPVFDQDGALTYYFASQFDVTLERDRLVRLQTDRDALEREIQQRTMDLRRSEDSLRFILKAGGFGSWTLDLADRRLVASALCKQNFGRSTDEPFTYDDLFAAIVPEDRARMQAAVKSAIDDQHEYNITYRIETPARELRWIEIRGQAHYHADGTPLSMVGISADVTERKRGEEHRALLAAELNHRVKNSMATMQSIAYQTLRNASTLDGAREDLEARIQSLAAAHDVLTRESWEGAMLDEIVAGALAPFRVGEVDRFKVGGPSIRLKPRLTLAISLALHELATNAVKYGALSNDSGHVLVSWAKETNQSVPRFSLRWEEVGGPTVEPPSRQGFGTRMIERALVSELKGSAQIDYRPRGVVFTLDAPIFSADDM